MSVPTWRRHVSNVGFLNETLNFNHELSKLANYSPKKYLNNYIDYMITSGMEAFGKFQTANMIIVNEFTTDYDFKERKRIFREGIAELHKCMGYADVFFERMSLSDEINKDHIYSIMDKLSQMQSTIIGMVYGIIKSDTERQKTYKDVKKSKYSA